MNAQWNWEGDIIKCALVTSSFTADYDTMDFFDDITNEVSGTNYVAGGQTLTAPTVTYDSASDEIRFDSDNPQWTGASFTARGAIVYKSTGTASTSPLICHVDFGQDETVSAGNFTITVDASGWFAIDAT